MQRTVGVPVVENAFHVHLSTSSRTSDALSPASSTCDPVVAANSFGHELRRSSWFGLSLNMLHTPSPPPNTMGVKKHVHCGGLNSLRPSGRRCFIDVGIDHMRTPLPARIRIFWDFDKCMNSNFDTLSTLLIRMHGSSIRSLAISYM
jgi:hypothetical protein